MSLRRIFLTLSTFGASVAPVSAQSLEDVLAKHHAAIGGAAEWQAVESMRNTGYLSLMGGMAEGPIVVTAKRPAHLRADLTIQGANVVQAYDGETGWMINPFTGSITATEMDPATLEAMIEQADIDGPLVGHEEEGIALALLGIQTVNRGREAWAIEVTFTTGHTSTYFVDAETYLLIRVEADRPGSGLTSTTLTDYRSVGGLMIAFATNSTSPQGDQAVAWDTVELNVELEDASFSMPGDRR